MHPELQQLVPVLASRGAGPFGSPPQFELGFFGGKKCERTADDETAWTDDTFSGMAYRGQHRDCLPHGAGRIRLPSYEGNQRTILERYGKGVPAGTTKGAEWIGGVTFWDINPWPLPLPSGFGELRLADGTRVFVRATFTAYERTRKQWAYGSLSFRPLGVATPDGVVRAIRSDQGGGLHELYDNFKGLTWPAFLMDRLGQPEQAVEYHPSGIVLLADLVPATGEITSSDVEYQAPRLGVYVRGGNADRGTAGRQRQWTGRLGVTLSQPFGPLPAGRYWGMAPTRDRVAFADSLKLIRPELVLPRDAETLLAASRDTSACPTAARDAALPPGWVVWTPSCGTPLILAFSADTSTDFRQHLDADGKVVRRLLYRESRPRTEGSLAESWEAPLYVVRGTMLVPQGETRYRRRHLGNSREPDGAKTLEFNGHFDGLAPAGVGTCAREAQHGGGSEPCEFRDGRRVDAAFVARVERMRLDALERERRDQVERQAAAARAEAAALAEAEEREEERRRERLEAEEEAEDEARRSQQMAQFWNNALAEARADGERVAQTMAASQRQYEAAVAAQSRSQTSNGTPPGVYDPRKAASDEAEYQRKLAAQQAAWAKARSDAEAAQARDAAAARAPVGQGSGYASSAGSTASSSGSPVPSECISEVDRKQGNRCGNPRSLSVEHRYTCGGTVSVRVCLSTPTGEDCGSQTLSQGESMWYYVCESTGGVRASGTTVR
jgi:hypothetical protein